MSIFPKLTLALILGNLLGQPLTAYSAPTGVITAVNCRSEIPHFSVFLMMEKKGTKLLVKGFTDPNAGPVSMELSSEEAGDFMNEMQAWIRLHESKNLAPYLVSLEVASQSQAAGTSLTCSTGNKEISDLIQKIRSRQNNSSSTRNR